MFPWIGEGAVNGRGGKEGLLSCKKEAKNF
jgi:hypothetical protein